MFGLELVYGAVFVAVGDGPVFVLVSEHELDLDAVALGLGERVEELLRLFGAHFGERRAEVEVVNPAATCRNEFASGCGTVDSCWQSRSRWWLLWARRRWAGGCPGWRGPRLRSLEGAESRGTSRR